MLCDIMLIMLYDIMLIIRRTLVVGLKFDDVTISLMLKK